MNDDSTDRFFEALVNGTPMTMPDAVLAEVDRFFPNGVITLVISRHPDGTFSMCIADAFEDNDHEEYTASVIRAAMDRWLEEGPHESWRQSDERRP